MPLAPGSRIGSHVVVSLIGTGGMGEVYRARDTTLDRDVAIKRLPDAVAADAERLARFEREAKTLAALNHPNVAQIYSVESGTIVMELVPGECLRGPLPLERALDYAAQIASALDAAHEKGIVHRDLKPGNVMVTPGGIVKVLDFSLAGRDRGVVEQDPEQSPTLTGPVTSAGLILGTAAYMAPEQASGRPVDKRADIFAFGIVLWEMLTGRRMFDGETTSHVLASVLTKEPDLDAVPARVRHLLSRCLEKDPRKRLRDIGDAMSLVRADEPAPGGATPVRAGRGIALGGWAAAAALAAAIVAISWPRPGANAGAEPPAILFRIPRAIDIYNQAATAFALSPDGRTLAYYDAVRDGQHALFLRTLETGDAREVQDTQTFNPRGHSLFWSPDGRQLVRGVQGGASVLDVSTGVSRPLCDCRFTGGSINRDGVVLLGAIEGAAGIRRLALDAPAPSEITSPDAARDRWPVFLSDGRRFLFTRTTDAGDVTYVGSLDGGAPTRLTASFSGRVLVTPAGGTGAYLVGIDPAGVVVQPIDPGTMTLSGAAIPMAPRAVAVTASARGVMVASGPGTRQRTIPTWFDRKGTPLGRVGDAAFLESLALSLDGRRLVAAESATGMVGDGNDIWVRNLETGVKTRLTFNPANDSTPVLSPDGSRVAYTSRQGEGLRAYQRSSDGTGNESPLFAFDRTAYVNDWSNDGRWIVFSTPPKPDSMADNDLWMVSMTEAGAQPKPYLAAPRRQQQAQFSPDGRFVAYGSEESGTFEIYVQPFPDPSKGKWMVSNGGGIEPRWSRDGTELFYFSGQTLVAVPVSLTPTFSSGAPVRLFDAAIQAGYTNDSHRWQVAADGKRFLLLQSDGQQQASPLEVLVNWSGLLKK